MLRVTELVVVKRLDHYGKVEVSQSIPYSAFDAGGNFTSTHGTPTVALALTDYYLASKAAPAVVSDGSRLMRTDHYTRTATNI